MGRHGPEPLLEVLEKLGKEEAEVAEDGCSEVKSGLCDQQIRI